MSFVDQVAIFVKGGDGGRGCMAFRREKFIPRGGPWGGDGGDGGKVIIRAVPGTDNLAALSFKRHWSADSGSPGLGKKMTGKSGEDLVLNVPPGTIIRDREHHFILKDLVEPHSELVIARGGRGGRGNAAFASSTNRAPRQFETGQPGEQRWIVLELKVIADVGLIGLPNAGKSTLLSRITHAHPEIADYPFTTKYPNLGIAGIDGERSCVVADIPGLIEGAHAGVGLGHEFLRHVERTKILVHMIESLPSDGKTLIEHYKTIRNELTLYSDKLVPKPEIVVISKRELTEIEPLRRQLEVEIGKPVLAISAVTGEGLKDLMREVIRQLDALQAPVQAV